MRIGIISRGKKNYSTRRLVEAAHELDHRVTLMDPWDCTMYLAAGGPGITHNERSVEGLDVVIPRLGTATADYGLEVVAHFQHVGVPCVNGAAAIETARHKWRSLRVLAERGLPVPQALQCSHDFCERLLTRLLLGDGLQQLREQDARGLQVLGGIRSQERAIAGQR